MVILLRPTAEAQSTQRKRIINTMKLLITLLVIISSLASAQETVVFREDFNDNKKNWPLSNNVGSKKTIENGVYTIENTAKDSWWYYVVNAGKIDYSDDLTIEAEITQISGSEKAYSGIVWAMWDGKYYQSFIASGANIINAYNYDRGKVEAGSGDKSITAMRPMGQPNKFTIEKKRTQVTYYINGTEVYSRRSAKCFGTNIGFMVNSENTIAVNYIEIRQTRPYTINLLPGIAKGFVMESLGPNINGKYDDVSPLISADGKTLYFSKYSPENYGDSGKTQDAYISYRNADNSWGKYKNIGAPINNAENNNIVGLSADNNTALCMNTYKADGTMGGGVSLSQRTASGWALPVAVKFDKYDTRGNHVGYSLSPGGDILVMQLERDTTWGRDDLYVSFKKPDGVWTEPMNLGPVVNSPNNDVTPFIAADGKTLYFSTSGRATYGSNDIFLTRRLDDSWTNWSEPENLGPDVNTDDWEAYFTVPASGEYAYYSSQKNSLGKSDIVRIKLPDAAKPQPLFLVSGRTFNAKTKQPIEAVIQYESLPDGNAVGSANSSVGTGDYTISLVRGKRYGFRAEKEGFFPVSDNLDATKLDKYTEVKKDLYLVPIEVGEVVRINNVFFDFAKFDLRPESYPDLNRLASFMKTNPNVEIQLLGHTDNVGKDGDNLKLSESRIQSVKAYLVGQGVAASRMSAKGQGETKPIAINDTEDGRQQNRRVEFVIVKK